MKVCFTQLKRPTCVCSGGSRPGSIALYKPHYRQQSDCLCVSTNKWLWRHPCSRRLLGFVWYNCYIFVHFSSTPTSTLNQTISPESQKTTFPTIYCPYGNIFNFSRTSRMQSSHSNQWDWMLIDRRTDGRTQSENSMSASFTPFTWRI